MDKLIITAAICGAEVMKCHNPAVPYTIDELIREAKGAYEAGASIIHLHVREDDGTPTQGKGRYAGAMKAIQSACPDVILQPSTGGAVGMSDEERLQPVQLTPEMATLDCGSVNFGGDDVFINTETTIRNFASVMKEKDIKPELEVFEQGMVLTALRLAKEGLIEKPMHFNLVMGVRGGIGGSQREFDFLIGGLPEDSTYTVSGIGRYQFEVAAMAIRSGGHVRVGLEDNIYISRGQLAASNAELVEKAVAMAKLHGREVASPAEARVILGLK